jgi:hypothetical protein
MQLEIADIPFAKENKSFEALPIKTAQIIQIIKKKKKLKLKTAHKFHTHFF